MGIVIDIATRRPLQEVTREWGCAVDSFNAPPEQTLIFDTDTLQNSMVRIAATVPREYMTALMQAWHATMLESGKAKVAS